MGSPASLLSTSFICPQAGAHIPESGGSGLCPQARPSFQLFHSLCPFRIKAPRGFQDPALLSGPASQAFPLPVSHLPLPTSGPLNVPLTLPGMCHVLLLSFLPPLLDESFPSSLSIDACREPSQHPRLDRAPMPDPSSHLHGRTSRSTDAVTCVLVCPPYQATELRERWRGLVLTAVPEALTATQ